MRHVCKPLSLDELKEAFNGQAFNVGIINMIELGKKLSSRYNDHFLKECNLLVFREYDSRLAPTFMGTCMRLRACDQYLGQR